MRFLVIAKHPPNLCPSSNESIRALAKQAGEGMPALAQKLGVKVTDTHVTYSDHRVFAVVEADNVDQVRELTIQGRLVQWNEVEIWETNTLEEAIARNDEHPAIF